MSLAIARTVADLRAHVGVWKAAGLRVGLVPTMGALHDGHLSLAKLAAEQTDRVVASVFVNPTQFAPHEDYDAYPRDEAGDAALLEATGCALLFAPGVGEMYGPSASTTVTVTGVSEPLDGAARPSHFAGVATVVTKLLLQAAPHIAVFGEKDYQQLQVIRRLVRDLDIPVEIVGGPIVRAEDGLALSSRNAYLTAAERSVAPKLSQALREAVKRLQKGDAVSTVEREAAAALLTAGFARIDYVEVRGAEDLARVGPGLLHGPARVLAAAVLGKTRLIDNMAV